MPIRSATVGVAVGVVGVVGGLVFSASLDRLVDTPARYGWDGDGAIIDIDENAADRVVADPDIAAATEYAESQVRVEDRIRVVSSYSRREGLGGLVGHQRPPAHGRRRGDARIPAGRHARGR